MTNILFYRFVTGLTKMAVVLIFKNISCSGCSDNTNAKNKKQQLFCVFHKNERNLQVSIACMDQFYSMYNYNFIEKAFRMITINVRTDILPCF
jgi:hypothetical protein